MTGRALLVGTVVTSGLAVAVPTPLPAAAATRGAFIEGDGGTCNSATHVTITAAVAVAVPGDVIHICPGVYAEPEIDVTVDSLTLQGEGKVVLKGGNDIDRHRIIDATGLTITLDNLTFEYGAAITGGSDKGGAVKAFGVYADGSVFRDNDAVAGGAIFVSAEAAVGEPWVVVDSSRFEDNGTGGSTVYGGAIFAEGGSVLATDSTFDGNEAMATLGAYVGGDGGAIVADSAGIHSSTFTRNQARFHGGAIVASMVNVSSDLLLCGLRNAFLCATSDPSKGPASVFTSNRVSTRGIAVGGDIGFGGAIWAYDADIEDALFERNVADSGGAVGVSASGGLSVRSSTFDGNIANREGGAIVNVGDEVGSHTDVSTSTFVGNAAGFSGGGIASYPSLELDYNTFVDNTAAVSGGVFWSPSPGSGSNLTADNNIFAVATEAPGGEVVNGCQDWHWDPYQGTGNITDNPWCLGTAVTRAELALGDLADHGGLTPTVDLGADSAAIDTIDCDVDAGLVDQRGVDRPSLDGCDAGAYEYEDPTPPDSLHVCVDRLSVRYGAAKYAPDVVFCVPLAIGEMMPSYRPDSGIPVGWRAADPSEFPGAVPPVCTADYVPGMGVATPPLPITCTGGDGGDLVLDTTFVTTLEVRPAKLHVRPEKLRVPAGSGEPRYPRTITGYRLDDTAGDLALAPSCDSGYRPTARQGRRFVITCGGGQAANYLFRYHRAGLRVVAPD